MISDLEIKMQSAQPTLNIRTHVAIQNLPQVLGAAFGGVIQYLGELGEPPAGPSFAAYLSDDMQNLDVAAGFIVGKALPGKGEIQPGEIPAGTYASCLYTGPYSGFGAAYAEFGAWIQAQGRAPVGSAYELYLDDPAQTPPDALRTILRMPLKD